MVVLVILCWKWVNHGSAIVFYWEEKKRRRWNEERAKRMRNNKAITNELVIFQEEKIIISEARFSPTTKFDVRSKRNFDKSNCRMSIWRNANSWKSHWKKRGRIMPKSWGWSIRYGFIKYCESGSLQIFIRGMLFYQIWSHWWEDEVVNFIRNMAVHKNLGECIVF